MGIHPDIIVLRCNEPLEGALMRKIAMFCNVREDCVIESAVFTARFCCGCPAPAARSAVRIPLPGDRRDPPH